MPKDMTDKETAANNTRFTPDTALKHVKDDLFHHSDFVDALEYVIEHSETPLNIALYGRWGVGKSTILNFLKERITTKEELRKKYQFVYVDAWKLSPESLRQELLVEFNKTFKAMDTEEIEDKLWHTREEIIPQKRGLKSRLEKIGKTIVPYLIIFALILGGGYVAKYYFNFDVLSHALFLSIALPILLSMVQTLAHISKSADRTSKRIVPRVESSQQFELLFEKIISKKKTPKLIIAIDNLDRCEDEAVVKILGTIKTFMNVKDCIYLIPCDENAIIKHLKARGGQFYEEREAIEFLAKFFQITLNIPPQIEGDLESYADKQMSTFKPDIEFDASVKDVLISGITKNPRKIRQFLYNIVVLYKLAQAKENAQIIRKGTITSNTGFLTKIVVLRDEWPDFYRKLENREDLLDLIQRHLDGERLSQPDEDEIKNVFEKNAGLEYFIKSTNLITATNISPFLKLNQESFESVIPELETLILRVSQNDVYYVRSAIEKLTIDERRHYIREILKLNDSYIKNRRFQFAFNSMNVLLEIFEQIPDDLKNEVISKFGNYMKTTKEIRESLQRYDTNKLFPLVIKMQQSSRDVLLKEYCRIMVMRQSPDKIILQHFIDNYEIVSPDVVVEFNRHLRVLGQQAQGELVKTLKTLSENEPIKTKLVNSDAIEELIQRIVQDASNDNRERVDVYFNLKNIASLENKRNFVERVISMVERNTTPALEAISQYGFDVISKLDKDDLPRELSDILYVRTKKYIGQFGDENHKKVVINALLVAYQNMSDSNRKEFAEQHLSPAINSLSPNFLTEICRLSKEKDVKILENEPIFNAILSKLNQTGPISGDVIGFVLEKSAAEKKEQVSRFIISMIKSGNPSHFQLVAEAFGRNHDKLTKEQSENICKVCLDIGRQRPWNEAIQLFTAVATSISQCSNETKNLFTDIMVEWIKGGDVSQRGNGISILGSAFKDLSGEKQAFVVRQILLKLETLCTQNDANIQHLLTFLIDNQKNTESEDLIKLVDIISGQMSTTRPAPIQTIMLQNISKVDLKSRSEVVLNTIFNLAKSTTDQGIRNTCKQTLKDLTTYAKGEFVTEVNKFFGEEVIKK